jgi:hypothetical protein
MSNDSKQVSCGLYRTTKPIGDNVSAGALVYYHNHGDPGPGLYLPKEWKNNRAVFQDKGITIPDEAYAQSLVPLLPEGFYRVVQAFYCCEDRCKLFDEDQLVQLGYNGSAQAILFLPELVEGSLSLPKKGTRVEEWKLDALVQLKVSLGEPVVEAHEALN